MMASQRKGFCLPRALTSRVTELLNGTKLRSCLNSTTSVHLQDSDESRPYCQGSAPLCRDFHMENYRRSFGKDYIDAYAVPYFAYDDEVHERAGPQDFIASTAVDNTAPCDQCLDLGSGDATFTSGFYFMHRILRFYNYFIRIKHDIF